MGITSVPAAIRWQADHAEANGAPANARIIRALLAILETDTATGRRMANWQGLSLEDAMPLRVASGLHYLYLTDAEPRLGDVYQGLMTDQPVIDELVAETARSFDTILLPWLDTPPQTNEAGRSAAIMAGLLWLSERLGPQFALNEIGASAGINTMMGRFHFDLGGVNVGPSLSSIAIAPQWRGEAPPEAPVRIVGAKGCDTRPLDLTDPERALRLKSYIWPDARERMVRMDRAIAMAEKMPPEIVRQDAGDFVDQMLAAPQDEGVTRVLFHTVMWQYLPRETRDRITQAMETAGKDAGADRPLAWLALETNRDTLTQELRVRYWPGGGDARLLATAHPHGEWVEWLA
ncbi:DUF2332 domain-containing protein [Aurantiacibacter spongiae]|uniref:DUF2332 domain-containing protein n=2 Tax=Aurantiacibacter spongiae TaxID=2488860 RepID=A0A3N5DMC7_9SPHN|nr:DUF2332 domain-containing protein [Aurantiacibacter spongiae]